MLASGAQRLIRLYAVRPFEAVVVLASNTDGYRAALDLHDAGSAVKAIVDLRGYLYGNGYTVTWAIGHLVTLAQPHEIDARWRAWRRNRLPMLPREWPLVVPERTRDQFELVCKVLGSDKIERVVCATDAGREGELIFRYIYEAAGCSKPVSRLWISSLTADAIRRGFDRLSDGSDFDPLADAARGRSRADWLVARARRARADGRRNWQSPAARACRIRGRVIRR